MTDEEMAEAWVKINGFPFGNCPNIENKLRQAFLEGLKEGKQQNWHDLTKDPNDLPPANPMCPPTSVQVFSPAKVPMHYCFLTEEWVSELSYETVNPIAWYYIPDYEWEN